MLAGKQIVIQGSAHTTNMQCTRRTRCKTNSYFSFSHSDFHLKIRRKINLFFPFFVYFAAQISMLMKSLHREQPFSYKELLYKCAISLVTVAVIVYFLPKEGKFNYQLTSTSRGNMACYRLLLISLFTKEMNRSRKNRTV